MQTYISEDFVSIYRKDRNGKNKKSDILIFGDPIEIISYSSQTKETKVKILNRYFSPYEGYIKGKPKTMEKSTLKMSIHTDALDFPTLMFPVALSFSFTKGETN